jgi:hypothetical protein
LLTELVEALRRYIIISSPQADTVTLWVAFTRPRRFRRFAALKHFVATKTCGKNDALFRARPPRRQAAQRLGHTSSALLRVIELHSPTMLIDEMDALNGARQGNDASATWPDEFGLQPDRRDLDDERADPRRWI